MSLVDEVLAEHTSQNASLPPSQQRKHPWCEGPHEGDDGVPWPCESVRLALSLQAAEQVVEAARDWHLRAYVEGWCDCGEGLCEMAQALAEYDKGGQG